MQKVKPNNTVRFAWWGAEEEGLLGSEYYVGSTVEDAGRRHRAVPELRHDRLAELHVRRLRRRQLRRHGRAGVHPGGLRPDRGRVRGVLRQPRPAVPGLGVLGSFGLRPVHRRRHSGGWPVHRRRGSEDGRRGGAVRRRDRCGVRPVLPPAVRQPHRSGSGRRALRRARARTTTSSATSTRSRSTSTPTPSPRRSSRSRSTRPP